MKIRKVIILLGLVTGILFSGCGENKAADLQKEIQIKKLVKFEMAKPDEKIPETFQKTIGSVAFDIQTVDTGNIDSGNLYHCMMKKQKQQREKIVSALSAGRAMAEESSEVHRNNDGGEFEVYCGTLEDDSYILAGDGILYDNAGNYETTICDAFWPGINDGQYSTEDELAFEKTDQAFKKITDIIQKSGYEAVDFHVVHYALDHKTMQQETAAGVKDGRVMEKEHTWSEADDGYYFFAEQINQGIPVYDGDWDGSAMKLYNWPLSAIYNAEGLQWLSMDDLYSFEQTEKKAKLLDFDAVAESLAAYYEKKGTGSSYAVKKAKLYQYPVRTEGDKMESHFGWMFEVYETKKNQKKAEDAATILLDAETGEKIKKSEL